MAPATARRRRRHLTTAWLTALLVLASALGLLSVPAGSEDAPGASPAALPSTLAVTGHGVPPELVPDFVALRGDPSDRIPGAKGIGPGRAASLLAKYGSLEACHGGRKPRFVDDLAGRAGHDSDGVVAGVRIDADDEWVSMRDDCHGDRRSSLQ